MENMTIECGTVSWFATLDTKCLMERSKGTLLMSNLLRYTSGAEVNVVNGNVTLKQMSYLHSALLLFVPRSARSWDGKVQRVVLMSCPSCCKPMEMIPSCSKFPKTSSWRCHSHTLSEFWFPSEACIHLATIKTEGVTYKRHPPTHTSPNNTSYTMGYFHNNKSDGVIVTFKLCWRLPENTTSHTWSVAMPAFVVTMGLESEVSSFAFFVCVYFILRKLTLYETTMC